MNLILQRLDPTDHGTPGALVDDESREVCKTLELPPRDNHPQTSCIPAGVYPCRRRWSPRHGMELFGVDEVPNRSDIEIHTANFSSQLLGCVAVGLGYGDIDGQWGITNSHDAFAKLMTRQAGVAEFTLDVRDPAPLPVPQPSQENAQ